MRKTGDTHNSKASLEVRELSDAEMNTVSGGLTARKAGEGQKDFLIVTMKEAFISS